MTKRKNIKHDIIAIIESCKSLGLPCDKERLVLEIGQKTHYFENYYRNIYNRIKTEQIKNDIGLYQDKFGNFKYDKLTAKRNGYL